MLERYQKLGGGVKLQRALVVRGIEILEEASRDREEGEMLDVGIVLWIVGHNVVDCVPKFKG